MLDFEIAESTASAIHARRDLLSNIAIERIREELCKLICGAGAVRILREYADVIGVVIPELLACVGFSQNTKYHCYDVYEHTLQSLAYNDGADLCTRMAILLHDVGKPLSYTEDEAGVGHFKGHSVVGERMTEQIMRRLRFDNATAQTVVSLVGYHDRDVSADRREVKRLMQVMPDADILRLVEVKRCDRLAHASSYSTPPEALEQIPSVLAQIREAGECVVLKDLCVNGKDLLALGVPAGKRLGEILNRLLDCVIDERLPNEREALLAAAKEML